jgi:hypothetical protein
VGPEEVRIMITDAIDRYDRDIGKARHDDLVSLTKETGDKASVISDKANMLSDKVTRLQILMDSLYGNGSGRQGAIEKLDEKVDILLDEKNKRDGSQETMGRVKTVIMWLAGGLGTALLAVAMEYFRKYLM